MKKQKKPKNEAFDSGAIRDLRVGKGRFDLLSFPALSRIAKVMERGAEKYAPRNWEKGMPYTRFVDSALRHISQFMMGEENEDHLGHAMFNIMAIMHFQEAGRNELDDRPSLPRKKQGEGSDGKKRRRSKNIL